MSFAVVGAGVVGLSTALELQKNFPSARVSIIADKFGVDTTSDVAAGIFRPATSFTGPNDTITRFVYIAQKIIFDILTLLFACSRFATAIDTEYLFELSNSQMFAENAL